MILVLSIILGLIPLLGIVWIVMGGWLTTVDGLFMTLILLTLSGILMLNAVFEVRARGLLKRKKAEAPPPKVEGQKEEPKVEPPKTDVEKVPAQKTG